MVVLPGPETISHRELITTLAARHKLPAVYPYRYFVTNGGLICYGPDELQQHRQAAGYVDRILKGEKPADLPVQAPTKYELVLNLKTATPARLNRLMIQCLAGCCLCLRHSGNSLRREKPKARTRLPR